MTGIARVREFDSSLAFLREGYAFVGNRCEALGMDAFRARIMLNKVVCMRGAEAARVFYAGDRFTRKGAIPQNTLRLLQDKNSVQTLDGLPHRHRKAMFMSLMSESSLEALVATAGRHWRRAIAAWQRQGSVPLLDGVHEVLTAAVCEWAGVPLEERRLRDVAGEFAAMIENAGRIGPGNWRAQVLRRRSERWGRSIVERIRDGRLIAAAGSPAEIVAQHRDADGELLDPQTAAVELINILRPTVAVGRFITFAALALHEHPGFREGFQRGDETDLENFVQEVRRFYPFFPGVGGRVREAFDWRGHRFAPGDWVLLDIYGTNHDRRSWEQPELFSPERFRARSGDPFSFIPQGGGAFDADHRCPGEWLTIALTADAVRILCRTMTYRVPPQDLRVSLTQLPTAPRSRFVLADVRAAA